MCNKRGLILKTFRENRRSYKTQRCAFKTGVNQEKSRSSTNLKSKRWNDFILALRPVSSVTAKNDNLQQPVYFAIGIVGFYTKYRKNAQALHITDWLVCWSVHQV